VGFVSGNWIMAKLVVLCAWRLGPAARRDGVSYTVSYVKVAFVRETLNSGQLGPAEKVSGEGPRCYNFSFPRD